MTTRSLGVPADPVRRGISIRRGRGMPRASRAGVAETRTMFESRKNKTDSRRVVQTWPTCAIRSRSPNRLDPSPREFSGTRTKSSRRIPPPCGHESRSIADYFFLAAFFLSSAPSAPSAAFFFFFLPSTRRMMRVLGIPKGLDPSTHFSSVFIWLIRSARVSTLRMRASRLFRFKLLSIDTLSHSSLAKPDSASPDGCSRRREEKPPRHRERRNLRVLKAETRIADGSPRQ